MLRYLLSTSLLSGFVVLNMQTLAYAADEATKSPVPQFHIDTFAGQIFWLLLLGIILYLLLAKVALPKVQETMDARDKLVFDTLQKAAKLRDKAEGLKIDYDRTFRHADDDAKALIQKTVLSIAKDQAAALAKANADMYAQVAAAEANLQAETAKLLKDIDSHTQELASLVTTRLNNN
jgi:F-type H+-transporting ATPase subunit b